MPSTLTKFVAIGIAIIAIAAFLTLDSGGKVEIENSKFDQDKFRSLFREYIFQSYKDQRGIHLESVLSAVGALSGFSLQQGIREELILNRGQPENEVFTIVKTKNGGKYYFGSVFDQPLFDTRSGQFSVWAIVAGGAQDAGASNLPDINALAKSNAEAVGGGDYGVLSVSANHQPKDQPLSAIRKHWEFTENILRAKGVDPLAWSWEIALVAQDIIILGKDAVDPTLAAQIVMESAISMAKIDPDLVIQ